MQRKTLSIATSLFALCLLLFLQTASKAITSNGWIYSIGTASQNGCSTQDAINVYDYGDHQGGGFYFASRSGTFRGVTMKITYNNWNSLSISPCTSVTITGTGTFTSYVNGLPVVKTGNYTLELWKGAVNGVNATWVQADLWSTDAIPVLLFATGPTAPTTPTEPWASKSPMKMGVSVIRPMIP